MSDRELVEMFLNRDPHAAEEAEKKYGAYCYSVAFAVLGSRPDAEECLNDTWMKLWEAIPPAEPGDLKLYAAKTARRLALNRAAANNRQKRGSGELAQVYDELSELIPSPSDTAGEAEAKELSRLIDRFLRGLPETHANVFIRRCFYMEPVKLIAERYGMSAGYVTLLLNRTRKKLKKLLIEEEFIDEHS